MKVFKKVKETELCFMNIGHEENYINIPREEVVEEGRFFNFAKGWEDVLLRHRDELYLVRVWPSRNRVLIYKAKVDPNKIQFIYA